MNEELKYINTNYKFSSKCTKELQELILSFDYAYYLDGVLMLTNKGEKEIGLFEEEHNFLDKFKDKELLDESFFYMTEDEYIEDYND